MMIASMGYMKEVWDIQKQSDGNEQWEVRNVRELEHVD